MELKLAYQDIPLSAVTSEANSEEDDHPHHNLIYGSSSLFWRRGADGTQSTITFDLGSGNTRAVEYAIFRGANLLIAEADNEVDLSIRGSTDNFSVSDVSVLSTTNITDSDLTGPHNEDIILTGSLSTAYRYWRIQIDSTTSFQHLLRKCFFGQFFDFDSNADVRYPYQANYDKLGMGFTSDAGTQFRSYSGKRRRQYRFNWNGMSDSVREDFEEKVLKYAAFMPIFLYEDAQNHAPLNAFELVYGWVNGTFESGEWEDLNSLSLDFVEDLAS